MEAGETRREQHRIVNNAVSVTDNNNISDRSDNDDGSDTWGTWEELLLASAVKRHGLGRWDVVAAEVQARTSTLPPSSSTPDACRLKYSDLSLRFTDAGTGNAVEKESARVPWLEDLRSLRVAELKREVQRYDVSILSLQLKVKRLEEEREKSLQSGEEDDLKYDRGKKYKDRSSDLEGSGPGKPAVNKTEEQDEERSVNESNSTCSERNKVTDKADDNLHNEGCRTGPRDPDPESSNSGEKEGGETEDDLKSRGDDSVSQVSGEAQSSASLGRGKRRMGRGRRNGDETETRMSVDGVGPTFGKSQPLVSGLLKMVRAHKYGPVFLNRLTSQESDTYAKLVRQHVDLETIEARLEQNYYPTMVAFYRDLLLLFNNAAVFFPKSSSEFRAAVELRTLVSNEIKNEAQKSDSTLLPSTTFQKPQLLFYKHKVPSLIACRRRSSIGGKPKTEEQKCNGNKSTGIDLKLKSEDKPVTGARSTRRTKKTPMKKPPLAEVLKSESKKVAEATPIDKKRNAAADFLKRIKTSPPVDAVKRNIKGVGNSCEHKKEKEAPKSKDKKFKSVDHPTAKEDSSPVRGSNGRPTKKEAPSPEPAAPSISGKRGREFKAKDGPKKARKRTRR